eukprot:COSAG01_NODE_41677_length_448_cov_2.017192_2_plen_64_part_01
MWSSSNPQQTAAHRQQRTQSAHTWAASTHSSALAHCSRDLRSAARAHSSAAAPRAAASSAAAAS